MALRRVQRATQEVAQLVTDALAGVVLVNVLGVGEAPVRVYALARLLQLVALGLVAVVDVLDVAQARCQNEEPPTVRRAEEDLIGGRVAEPVPRSGDDLVVTLAYLVQPALCHSSTSDGSPNMTLPCFTSVTGLPSWAICTMVTFGLRLGCCASCV